ncbi:hypothetical protein GCM10011414_23180 [Croceivirga lutea]|uniref:DUF6747 family protein n=1 Tax=Croceivirga lutea TaxID=1775167 RepID=UPI00163AD441|nr:DUF6747 family protein [Croceivirga lutea]GGG52911.1 hypothetical protein GCM10011414_23180 [Croceivirga lutea]
MVQPPKVNGMEMIVNFKNLYLEAFRNCRPNYLVMFLKAYSVFSAAMILMAVYVLVYRAVTGFEF